MSGAPWALKVIYPSVAPQKCNIEMRFPSNDFSLCLQRELSFQHQGQGNQTKNENNMITFHKYFTNMITFHKCWIIRSINTSAQSPCGSQSLLSLLNGKFNEALEIRLSESNILFPVCATIKTQCRDVYLLQFF